MALPPSVNFGDPDAIVTYLRNNLGITLKGDAKLHLAAGMPFRVHDAIPAATLSAAIAASALSAADQASLTTLLGTKRMTK